MEAEINQELDLLAAAVRASVSLDDTEGRVLGYSVQSEDADPARIAAILTRRVPEAASAWQKQHGVDQATRPVRIPGDPDHKMVGRLCVPVRQQDQTLALLWILETTRVLNSDEVDIAVRTADRLAERLAERLALAAPAAPRRSTPSDLLRRLSRGEGLEHDEPISLASPRSLSVTVTLPVTPQDGPGVWSASETSDIERSLAALLRANRACAAAYAERDHATLLYLNGPTDTVAELRQRITAAAPTSQVVTGTGASDNLREALDRARTAARWAALDPALPRDATWAFLGLHQLASALLQHTGADALTPLLAHDASGPMLLTTIEIYLDLAANAQRTATALHLHRTTLYYRLNRAEELLGLDLSDGMVRSQLHLTLKRRRLAR